MTSQATRQHANGLDVEALQAEVQKWQERVPKLAAALRERSEELEQAKTQLRELQQGQSADARLQARDELIQELEGKLAQVTAEQRDLAGQLHTAQLESQAGSSDAAGWKEKWQTLTATLDECVAEKEQLARQLAEAQSRWESNEQSLLQQTQDMQDEFLQEIAQLNTHIEQVEGNAQGQSQQLQQHLETAQRLEQECNSLSARNQTLQDSAELANNQMASMGEELDGLNRDMRALQTSVTEAQADVERAQAETSKAQEETLKAHEETQRAQDTAAAYLRDQEELRDAMQKIQADHSGLQQENRKLAELQDQAETALAELKVNQDTCQARELADVVQLCEHQEKLIAQLQQELVEIVSRLTDEASQAQREHADAIKQVEQLQMHAQENQQAAETARSEAERARAQLTERSALVRELEAEMQSLKGTRQEERNALQSKTDQLQQVEADLAEANNRADTQRQHAQQLEQKLHQQMELLNQLEDELSQAQRASNDSSRQAEEKLRSTQEQQAALREENAELRHELARAHALQAEHGDGDVAKHEMFALHKELEARDEEVARLRRQVQMNDMAPDENVVMVLSQQLKDAQDENQRLLERLAQQPPRQDDLTRIKGIGRKLADQLSELGFSTYMQMAQLTPAMLEDEGHPLHAMRSRALSNDWITQACELVGEFSDETVTPR